MHTQDHARNLVKYVLPTMLSNVAFLLFTIVDGIFVGNGVGTNALGAVNLVMPFVLNTAVILLLPRVLGANMIWHAFGIFGALVLIVAVVLLKRSERNGIEFK